MRVASVALTVAVLVGGSVVAGTRLFATPTPQPASPEQEIGSWTRNVYVLDPANLGERSTVRAFAEAGPPRLLHGLTAGYYFGGYDPQMTLSPDGSRVYVLSSLMPEGVESYRNVIDTYDARTGQRLSRAGLPELDGANKNRTLHKLPVWAPDFVSSLEGTRLYLGERTIRRGPVRSKALVGTFDVAAGSLLPNSIELPDCNLKVFLPGPAEDALAVVCSATTGLTTVPGPNFVYFLRIAEDGSAASFERLDLPRSGVPDEAISWASATPDGGTIYAVTRAGHVFEIDAATQTLRSEADLEPRLKVQAQKVAVSPDGGTLYVGTAPLGSSSIIDANEIVAFDTQTWDQVASVTAEDPFWTMTLGPGGDRIYAPTYGGRLDIDWSIQVFDARTLEQLGRVEDVGRTPSLIEVPRLGR